MIKFNNIISKLAIVANFLLLSLLFSCSSINKNTSGLPLVMLGKVDFKGDSTSLNIQKYDAALNLALKISGKYSYFGISQIQQFLKENPEYSNSKISDIAKQNDVDYLAISQVNTLKHIIRTNIALNSISDDFQSQNGIGYDEVNYIDSKSGELVYDTSLLNSLMRALSSATKDSLLYVKKDLDINIKPVPTLVIGSIAFLDNSDAEDEWNLYLDKEISSYSAVETIYDIIKYSNDYVVYDTETRDTVYNLFGFHIVENYSQPSNHEIKALYQMAIDYYVAGSLVKSDDGAELMLGIYLITNDGLKAVKVEKENFTDDSRMVFLEHINRATKRLFNLP